MKWFYWYMDKPTKFAATNDDTFGILLELDHEYALRLKLTGEKPPHDKETLGKMLNVKIIIHGTGNFYVMQSRIKTYIMQNSDSMPQGVSQHA